MKINETMDNDTLCRQFNINMTLDEKIAINTVNKLLSHIISVAGVGTSRLAEKDGILLDVQVLAQAEEALKAIANNKEWYEV